MSLFDRLVVGTLPLLPKSLVGHFSRRYIAGESLEEAMAVVRNLNAAGMSATIDVLGEHTTTAEQAEGPRRSYLQVLDEIHRTGLDSNISIKPTQLGLKVDLELCCRNLRTIVDHAREQRRFVRMDMEDSACTTDTLEVYDRLRADHDNVGVVLQAMLRRTRRDAEALAREKANIRLCKGIYVEPRHLAYQDRELINRSFILVLESLLEAGCYVGIATHDERLILEAQALVRRLGLSRHQYEFQMLLGVEEELRGLLVSEGHPLRVYVPFGAQWYAYSLRRLRENPRIAGTVARAALRGQRPRQSSG